LRPQFGGPALKTGPRDLYLAIDLFRRRRRTELEIIRWSLLRFNTQPFVSTCLGEKEANFWMKELSRLVEDEGVPWVEVKKELVPEAALDLG
jgi:hypothetical protein